MSAILTRSQRKQATRETLQRAARACFVARGFAGTGIGDIAGAAGVAHGTFYVHYPSKEAVLDELLAGLNRELAARIGAALAAPADLEAAVTAAAGAFLDFCREHDRLVACYLERAAGGLDPAAFRDGINPPVAALLRQALARAGRGGAELELVTHGLLALWLRIGLRHLGGAAARADAVRVLTAMTVGAVRALEVQP
ncbi:MAG TPA: TetR/AcrR family transcriptional regulator [Kofleriaceae bacterium]|nr:TetR/AcrR family transcriptional regulator [Kofleriaceae bacterium]